VAQAIARTLPDATRIEVDTQTIRFSMNGQRYAYLTPYQVTGYVIAFDAGEEIEPFKFQLREDKRVPIRTKGQNTAAGKARQKASRRRHTAKTRLEKAEQALSDATQAFEHGAADVPTSEDLENLRADVNAAANAKETADDNFDRVREENPGRTREPDPVPSRKAPPRVFKMKKRSYGHRLLRINQKSA
jgi:hypothetical protein